MKVTAMISVDPIQCLPLWISTILRLTIYINTILSTNSGSLINCHNMNTFKISKYTNNVKTNAFYENKLFEHTAYKALLLFMLLYLLLLLLLLLSLFIYYYYELSIYYFRSASTNGRLTAQPDLRRRLLCHHNSTARTIIS